MPVNPRNTDFIGYMESRRKKSKYLTDYLMEIIIWISKKIFIYITWPIFVLFKTMIIRMLKNQ
jgi:hypothetical protein